MNVLLLAQWYPPILGGEELHVANLGRELAARGHRVTVATLLQEGLADEERDGDVRVVRLTGTLQRFEALFADSARRSAAPVADPALTLAIDRLVREERIDVMHAHNWLVHAALPVRAARGVPLVQTLHDFSQACAQKVLLRHGRNCSGPGPIKCLVCTADHYGPIKGPITTLANWSDGLVQRRLVDRFIAVSRAVAEGNRLRGTRHQVIPNFVPDAVPEPGPEAGELLAGLPTEPFVLYVGALGRLKGVQVLLDAWRAGPDLPPLALIGYRTRETDELLRDLPPHVRALGAWPHAAVQAAWPRAMLGVLPSVCREACPTVILEAMRAGRPTIGTTLGGTPDLIDDGDTGLLVEPGNADALAAAVRRIAADPGAAQAMGRRAQVKATGFTASAVVPGIEAVYAEVVKRRPSQDVERAPVPGVDGAPGVAA